MKNRTDLILGEAFCIFIFFYFLDSGLSVLNGLQFYFRLRDSENREYPGEMKKKLVMQNFRGQTRCIMGDSNHRGIFFDKIYTSLPGEAVDIDSFRLQSSS